MCCFVVNNFYLCIMMLKQGCKAPIFAVCRHRIGVDGPGITTLVTFMGCTLRCKYCPNDVCHNKVYNADGILADDNIMLLSPRELYDKVRIDNLYFRATGGGVCFGGGESALRSRFIEEFRHLCGGGWKLTIETSLNCAIEHVRRLLPVIDYWIIDVKDMNVSIYKNYTCRSQAPLLCNLEYISSIGAADKAKIRVPHIYGYNTDDDVRHSIMMLTELGFRNIEKMEYVY